MSEKVEHVRLQRIRIRNILCHEELEIEIDPEANVHSITGGNAVGKTAVLEAIKAAGAGGHDATLLRKGAEEGEVVLVLEDGTEIERRVSAEGSTKSVRHPDMGRIGAPQTWINSLLDAVALDPARFLATTGPERVRMLMEAWPVEADPDELQSVIGDAFELPELRSLNALEAVGEAHALVYDERTGINRVAKEKEATASQLAADLPDDTDADAIEDRLGTAKSEHATLTEGLSKDRERIQAERDVRREEIREKAAAEIRRIEEQRDAALQETTDTAIGQWEALVAESGPMLEDLRSEIDRLEERARHAAAHAQARKTVEQMRAEAGKAKDRSRQLTRALSELDALKARYAAELPIDGVSIVDGEVHLDGIPFPRLNHARQLETAIALAAKRAGKLGIVCVDGLEALDADTWPKLINGLEKTGLQAFVTRVTKGPLAVGSVVA